MKRRLGNVFIILGICIFLLKPIINNFIGPALIEKQQRVFIDDIKNNEVINIKKDILPKELEEEKKKFNKKGNNNLDYKNEAEDNNFNYEEVNNTNLILPVLDKDSLDLLGVISIPSIDLELPIIYGTTNKSLKLGAGTMREDQIMGEGNYPLSGHKYKNKDTLFSKIGDIKNGDKIILYDGLTYYTYEKFDEEVVDPKRIEVIEDNFEYPTVTLVTCWGKVGEERLIVYGKLIKP